MCFLHGREILRKTGRPQGLLETSWGGTSIESWSSSAALQQCDGAIAEKTLTNSPQHFEDDPDNGPRWAAMVAPLLSVGIRGALWSVSAATLNQSKCEMQSSSCCCWPLVWTGRYQGEANAGNIDKSNKYACQIKALIEDWRNRWATEGNLLSPAGTDFPFIVASLAPEAGNASPVLR